LIEYNFNDIIEVELTEHGFKVLADYYNKLYHYSPEVFEKMTIEKAKKWYRNEDGKSKFFVWWFMKVFGNYFGAGMEQVCKMNFKIIPL